MTVILKLEEVFKEAQNVLAKCSDVAIVMCPFPLWSLGNLLQ